MPSITIYVPDSFYNKLKSNKKKSASKIIQEALTEHLKKEAV